MMGDAGKLLIALSLSACASQSTLPDIEVREVTPDVVTAGTSTPIEVVGSGFRLALRGNLDNGVAEADDVTIRLDENALADVVLQDQSTLSATVGANLSVGIYDLHVSIGQRSAVLTDAISVVQPCERDSDCQSEDACSSTSRCVSMVCEPGPPDKDADSDGFVDAACGGDDCDDSDMDEFPGQLWYPDTDGDGLGDPGATPSECERGSPTDVLNDGNCGDSALPCDDGDACTEFDACVLGVCQGVNTCAAQCTNECSGSCGTEGCCIETCAGSCASSNCEAGCSCDLTCNASDCSTNCNQGAHCLLRASNANTVSLNCASDSSCTLECNDQTDECSLSCASGSSCLLTCGSADPCTLTCASGTTEDCGGGVLACRRDCPGS